MAAAAVRGWLRQGTVEFRHVRPMIRLLLPLALVWSAACAPDMSVQPKYKALSASEFFRDGRSARPSVEGTVPRGGLRIDERYFKGRSGGGLVGTVPFRVTRQVLERGRERFNIYCTPCHGYVGNGDGMVSQRGSRKPPSYHIARLREAPDGYFFDVMTNGFGAMISYASRVAPQDRWAITAYIRALQLSQGAKINDVPEEKRQLLLGASK